MIHLEILTTTTSIEILVEEALADSTAPKLDVIVVVGPDSRDTEVEIADSPMEVEVAVDVLVAEETEAISADNAPLVSLGAAKAATTSSEEDAMPALAATPDPPADSMAAAAPRPESLPIFWPLRNVVQND